MCNNCYVVLTGTLLTGSISMFIKAREKTSYFSCTIVAFLQKVDSLVGKKSAGKITVTPFVTYYEKTKYRFLLSEKNIVHWRFFVHLAKSAGKHHKSQFLAHSLVKRGKKHRNSFREILWKKTQPDIAGKISIFIKARENIFLGCTLARWIINLRTIISWAAEMSTFRHVGQLRCLLFDMLVYF